MDNKKVVYEGSFTKRSIVFLSVLIVIMVVLLVTATYAYFSTSASSSASVKVNNTLPGNGSCAGTGTGTQSFTVTYANMTDANKSNTASKGSKTSSVITLTASSSGTITNTCTYSVVWKNGSSQAYTQTSGVSATVPEYSFKLESSTDGGTTWSAVTLASGLKDTSGKPTTLTSISGQYQFPTMATSASVTLVSGATLASSSGTSTTVKYRITTYWYNNTLNQNSHAAKTYGGALEFASLSSAIS